MSPLPQKIGLLDTGLATENTGDFIIMEAARQEAEEIFEHYQMLFFPSHEKLSRHSYRIQKQVAFNVACGTNLLHSHMGLVKQWNIGMIDAFQLAPVVLFGVGWRSHRRRKTDPYTRWLLRRILSRDHLHSVRDSYAKEQLQKIGIQNVLVTGCPTTWRLDPEFCRQIPRDRGENAIVVLTDYSRAREDRHLLDFVLSQYRTVYFWAQGTHDLEYLQELGYADRLEIIPPSLSAYRKILADDALSLDYVGTRLHGGIFALKHRRRSVLIAVDHRARRMGQDLNLPVIDRYAPAAEIEKTIMDPIETRVCLPDDEIHQWRDQFRDR